MGMEEEDIFKDAELPLGEDEDEEMEDEEEEEELNNLEKENEPEEEEVEEEDDDEEPEGEADEDEEEEDDSESRVLEESPATSTSTKETLSDDSSSKTQNFYNTLLLKASIANSYDVVPKVAIPHSTAVHSFALPRSSKWLFTGGEDGYIRKYDFFASIDGDVQLTTAQRHSLVDLITNAGVILGYWENEIPVMRSTIRGDTYEPKLSPVYSLAVEDNCLWLLSGLSTGGINLQSVRHNEGTIVHHFQGHSNTVSELKLNQSQDKFISGSWDHGIHEWDLNTGDITNSFKGSTGQVSSLQYRPCGGISLDQIQQPTDEDDMDSLFGGDEEEGEDTNPKSSSSTQEQPAQTRLDDNVFLSSSMDGSLYVWDVRMQKHALRLKAPKGTPPWCVSACWSHDGNSIFAGRRNSCVEEFSLKMPFSSDGDSKVAKTLKFPSVSGAVTAVSTLPNDNHIVCGSFDNIRIYDLRLHDEGSQKKTPFLIIPGHHGGTVSDIMFDPTYRYMMSGSGNRGWQGTSIESVFIYEVGME